MIKRNTIMLVTGIVLLLGSIAVFKFFIPDFPLELNLCLEGKLWGCQNILYYQVLPILVTLSAIYYIWIGHKKLEVNKVIYWSVLIQFFALILGILSIPTAIIGCILYPDPFCFVIALPLILIALFSGVAGFITFIVGFVIRLIKGK